MALLLFTTYLTVDCLVCALLSPYPSLLYYGTVIVYYFNCQFCTKLSPCSSLPWSLLTSLSCYWTFITYATLILTILGLVFTVLRLIFFLNALVFISALPSVYSYLESRKSELRSPNLQLWGAQFVYITWCIHTYIKFTSWTSVGLKTLYWQNWSSFSA